MNGELLEDAETVSHAGHNLLESAGLVMMWTRSEYIQLGPERFPFVLLVADHVLCELVDKYNGPSCMKCCLGKLMRQIAVD
jgi:hypothetical protein